MNGEPTHKRSNCLYVTLHLLQIKAKGISAFRQILKSFKMEECNPNIGCLDFDDLVLVHGTVDGFTKPNCLASKKRINHAWLEFDGCIIENSGRNKHIIGKDAYYSGYKAECSKRFSSQEAFQNLMDGYGVGFWHDSGQMQKVEASSLLEEILARDFMIELQTDDHGAGCTKKSVS